MTRLLLTACLGGLIACHPTSEAPVTPLQEELPAVEVDALAAKDEATGNLELESPEPEHPDSGSELDYFGEMALECNFRIFPPPDKKKFGAFQYHVEEFQVAFYSCCGSFEYGLACPGEEIYWWPWHNDPSDPRVGYCGGTAIGGACNFAWKCEGEADNDVRIRFRDPATGLEGEKTFTYTITWDAPPGIKEKPCSTWEP